MPSRVGIRIGLRRALDVVRSTVAPNCFLTLRNVTSAAQTRGYMGFHILTLLFAGHLLLRLDC